MLRSIVAEKMELKGYNVCWGVETNLKYLMHIVVEQSSVCMALADDIDSLQRIPPHPREPATDPQGVESVTNDLPD